MATILALDFGGTKHTAGVIELAPGCQQPGWTAHRRQFTPSSVNAQIDLEIILHLADEVLSNQKPDAVGVSFGGPVDAGENRILLSHHVPGWENFALGGFIQQRYHCPVVIDNDANAAAFGEHRFGAGRNCSSLMYITISTGVGGGLILANQIWHGANSMAGEIGHMTIDPNGPLCLCGKHGCVERLASGPYLAQDARQELSNHPELRSTLRDLCQGDLANITSLLIAQAAEQGDMLARELIKRSARAVGTAIGNTANLINPQRFILGGGVSKAGDYFWEQVWLGARETALPQVQLDILPAGLGDDAPLWGAAALGEMRIQSG